LVDSGNNLHEAGNTIARNVSMVGQSIESRTRSTLVFTFGSPESVFASDVNWFVDVYEKSLGFFQLVDRPNSCI
jgi:hypothetical protein